MDKILAQMDEPEEEAEEEEKVEKKSKSKRKKGDGVDARDIVKNADDDDGPV